MSYLMYNPNYFYSDISLLPPLIRLKKAFVQRMSVIQKN